MTPQRQTKSVTDQQRMQVINLRENAGLTFRQISDTLGIGYENTRKIHRVYLSENRTQRLRQVPYLGEMQNSTNNRNFLKNICKNNQETQQRVTICDNNLNINEANSHYEGSLVSDSLHQQPTFIIDKELDNSELIQSEQSDLHNVLFLRYKHIAKNIGEHSKAYNEIDQKNLQSILPLDLDNHQ